MQFKNSICQKEKEFYLIEDHSAECIKNIMPKKEDLDQNYNKAYKLSNFKNELIEFLNKNPLTKVKEFKKIGKDKLLDYELNIYSNDNFFKNIFYPWKESNLSFKWYSAFENNKTKINKLYLRESLYTYLYQNSINKPFLHRYLIWSFIFFYKKIAKYNTYIYRRYFYFSTRFQTIISYLKYI